MAKLIFAFFAENYIVLPKYNKKTKGTNRKLLYFEILQCNKKATQIPILKLVEADVGLCFQTFIH